MPSRSFGKAYLANHYSNHYPQFSKYNRSTFFSNTRSSLMRPKDQIGNKRVSDRQKEEVMEKTTDFQVQPGARTKHDSSLPVLLPNNLASSKGSDAFIPGKGDRSYLRVFKELNEEASTRWPSQAQGMLDRTNGPANATVRPRAEFTKGQPWGQSVNETQSLSRNKAITPIQASQGYPSILKEPLNHEDFMESQRTGAAQARFPTPKDTKERTNVPPRPESALNDLEGLVILPLERSVGC